MQALRLEDGPPLPMARDLRWSAQLQSLRPVPDISLLLLLGVFRDICDLGLERDPE